MRLMRPLAHASAGATLAIALLAPAYACSASTSDGRGGTPTPTAAASASASTTSATAEPGKGTGTMPGKARVLAISVDGLNPRAIRQLGRSGAPNFYRLTGEGAWTFNARTERENTTTLANHAGMLTGRRVAAARGGHGVTWDDDRAGSTVQGGAGHPVSSIFTVVHNHGGSTALFSTKEKFSLYQRSWPHGIDRFVTNEADPVGLLRTARRDLTNHARSFTFLHISFPDKAGHAYGFMSAAYVDAVHQTDVELGKLLAAIDGSADLSKNLTVILTADHGGIGPSHSQRTELQNYRIPFIVWGPGVTHDSLYDLNPDYRDPGTARPRYAGRQPVRNADVANLAADVLGLKAVPGSELDAEQDLDVAVPVG